MYTTVNDYLPKLQEMFPTIKKSDLKRMAEYGWRMFYFYNLRGCDTVIDSKKHKFWMYCGDLYDDSVKFYNYYRKRLRCKLRVLYAKKKIAWDGYYYTFLNDDEYKEILNKKKRRGRPKKYYHFKDKLSFKIQDEAKLYYNWAKYIIKFKYNVDMGYSFHKNDLKCEDFEIVLERESPDKFKDILITNAKYELL